MVFPGGSVGKESASNARDPGSILGGEDPLEERMATHSSILAWRTPWTEELVGDSPWGQKDSHDSLTHTHTHTPIQNLANLELEKLHLILMLISLVMNEVDVIFYIYLLYTEDTYLL